MLARASKLNTDEELKAVIRGLRVIDGHRSLDELRSEINFRATVVGVLACNAADWISGSTNSRVN